MRNPQQDVPDHALIVATFARSVAMPTRPTGPAGAVPPGTVLRVNGVVRPGPAGVLTAPLSGRFCVWYRAVQLFFPPHGPLGWQAFPPTPSIPFQLGSDVGYQHSDSRTDDESRAPFVIDTASGPVTVDPVGADVHASVVSAHAVEGRYGLTQYVIRHEWIIEAGTPVFAMGPAQPPVQPTAPPSGEPPTLRADAQNCLVVNVDGEQAAAARSQQFLAARGATPLGGLRTPSPVLIAAVVAGVLVLVVAAGLAVLVLAG